MCTHSAWLRGMVNREVIVRKEPYKELSVPQIVGTVAFDEQHRIRLPKRNPFGERFTELINNCLSRNQRDRPAFEDIVKELVIVRKDFEKRGKISRRSGKGLRRIF